MLTLIGKIPNDQITLFYRKDTNDVSNCNSIVYSFTHCNLIHAVCIQRPYTASHNGWNSSVDFTVLSLYSFVITRIKCNCMFLSLFQDPLSLDRCIICCEQDWDDCFEIQEFVTKEQFVFKVCKLLWIKLTCNIMIYENHLHLH